MAEHDWHALHAALTTATGEHSRDELMGLLRDLIREYVIERGLPTGAPTATTPDLTALDFPRLITWLKRNLSVPELGLFEVDGDRVIVDADGPRVLSVAAPRTPLSAPTPPARSERRPAPAPASRPTSDGPAPSTRPAAATSKAAADRLSPGFRGLEFD